MSAGGFKADAGLAEREMSMGDDLGRSDSSSSRAPSIFSGGVGTSDSLEGDELSVVIRSLSRKPVPASSSISPPRHRSLPFALREGVRLKELERGELTWDSGGHQTYEGRRSRLIRGAESSLLCDKAEYCPFCAEDEGKLDDDDGSAKSERDVDRDGRTALSLDSWLLDVVMTHGIRTTPLYRRRELSREDNSNVVVK